MFDDLRNDAASQFDDEPQSDYQFDSDTPAATTTSAAPRAKARPKPFLGLTSLQRFVLVFLMMIATFVLGFLCLFATGRIVLF